MNLKKMINEAFEDHIKQAQEKQPEIIRHIKLQLQRFVEDESVFTDMIDAFERIIRMAMADNTSDSVDKIARDLDLAPAFVSFHTRIAKRDKSDGLLNKSIDVKQIASTIQKPKAREYVPSYRDENEMIYGNSYSEPGGHRTGD